MLQEIVRVTKPGGYIELAEAGNGYQHVGTCTQTFLQWGQAASARKGIDLTLMKYLRDLLASVGYRLSFYLYSYGNPFFVLCPSFV